MRCGCVLLATLSHPAAAWFVLADLEKAPSSWLPPPSLAAASWHVRYLYAPVARVCLLTRFGPH